MIDRGFIKWMPFNSVIPTQELLKNDLKEDIKPTLFPEEENILNDKIMEAYFSQNKITITFYEHNTIKKITTYITKIYPPTKTIKLTNNKIITFSQIINIT